MNGTEQNNGVATCRFVLPPGCACVVADGVTCCGISAVDALRFSSAAMRTVFHLPGDTVCEPSQRPVDIPVCGKKKTGSVGATPFGLLYEWRANPRML